MAASMKAASSSSRIASDRSRAVFGTGRAALMAPSRLVQRRVCAGPVRVQAMIRQYPDPDFIREVMEAFPDKGIAEPDEVRVLLAKGYTWLDVRPALEYEEAGKVKGSVNVPIMNMTKKFVGEGSEKKKVYEKTPNPDFVSMVEKKFPNKDQAIMVGCSDGKTYSIDALMALDEAGYTHLVGIRGGFYAWFRMFDNKLMRRNLGEYQEKYDGEGSDSCGIHASGAGFEKVDKIESWAPPTF